MDRADVYFQSGKFFIFAKPDGEIVLQWLETLPSDWEILGRVAFVKIPHLPGMGNKPSGWMEEVRHPHEQWYHTHTPTCTYTDEGHENIPTHTHTHTHTAHTHTYAYTGG